MSSTSFKYKEIQKPMLLRNSIIIKTLSLLIFVIVLIMSLSGFFFIKYQKKAIEQTTFQINNENTQQVLGNIEQDLYQFGQQLTLLSKTSPIQAKDSVITASYLKSFDVSSLFKSDEKVTLYNQHNEIICDNSMIKASTESTPFKDFSSVIPHRAFSSEWYFENNIPYKFFAITVDDKAAANGTLVANFSFKRIWQKYSSYKIGQNGFLILFDNRNRVLMHPELQRILTESLDANFFDLTGFLASSFVIEEPTFLKINGVNYFATYQYNARFQIGALALQPQSEIQELIHNMAFIIVLLLASTLFATVFIILILFKKFAFPLKEIIQKTNFIANGNFDTTPLPVLNSKSELGLLTTSFNQMHFIIKKQIKDLENHRDNLETLVKERTQELEDAKIQLELISKTDELTKLPNRRDMFEKIHLEASRSARSRRDFCFVYIDIDKFKEVNDTYGHNFGDTVLKTVANVLRHSLRKYDYLARWGGEEFLCVLPETDLNGATIVAERFRKKVAKEKIKHENIEISVTITLGVALYNSKLGVEKSIQLADTALYKGKESGRNQVVTHNPEHSESDSK